MIGSRLRTTLSLIRGQRGTAVTEFVVTLPILLLFLFGLTGIAQAIWYHHIITKGVRDGTRYLTRVPLTEEFKQKAKLVAMTGSPTGTEAFSFWHDPSTVAISTTSVPNNPTGTFRTPGPVTVVQMTATVPVEIPILGFQFLGLSPSITYVVADQARWIGE